MSLKLFIVSAFQATIFGWMIWKNATMATENERLRHKNKAFGEILYGIDNTLRYYADQKTINEVKKFTNFKKRIFGITDLR